MGKRSSKRKRRKVRRRLTYRQVFRTAICKATGQPREMVDNSVEALVRSTPDFRSINLDSPAPARLLDDLLSRPLDVQAWVIAGRLALETGNPNGTVEGRYCPFTKRLIVDRVLAI